MTVSCRIPCRHALQDNGLGRAAHRAAHNVQATP